MDGVVAGRSREGRRRPPTSTHALQRMWGARERVSAGAHLARVLMLWCPQRGIGYVWCTVAVDV
jgi:hypothetical protein